MLRLRLLAGAVLISSLLAGCPVVEPPAEENTPDDGLPSRVDAAGEGPRLGTDRITQEEIVRGEMSLREIRMRGRAMFTTPFNKLDGYGDGPMNPDDPTSPGGRPTLQGNGTFLRVNGLDAQTCLECHSIISNATIPATFGVGGVGAGSSNAIFKPTKFDMTDEADAGLAGFNGRFINPPFLFGSGGIELLGKEMTQDLQALKAQAEANPGVDVRLVTKGIDFGVIRFENGVLDTSRVEGVDPDLVVKPFGRKGQFPSVRAFDIEAMMFHFGMQPVEFVGEDTDADGDGVMNEILSGELSALHVFNTTLDRPVDIMTPESEAGFALFDAVGCTTCHVPFLTTDRRELPYTFPEVPERPFENEFYRADLTAEPTGFDPIPGGGVVVPLFADLKRHDMGTALAESFNDPLDHMFTTARLWGVADTAPYLHDGRAMTLMEAIMMHGGEASEVRDTFASLEQAEQHAIIDFLRTLRTPENPAGDLDE